MWAALRRPSRWRRKLWTLSSGGQFYVAVLGAAYAAAGRTDDARAALDRLDEMSASCYVSPYHRALIHLLLGEREQALALLGEAYIINEGWLVWLGVEPQLDPLRVESGVCRVVNARREIRRSVGMATPRARAAAQRYSTARTECGFKRARRSINFAGAESGARHAAERQRRSAPALHRRPLLRDAAHRRRYAAGHRTTEARGRARSRVCPRSCRAGRLLFAA